MASPFYFPQKQEAYRQQGKQKGGKTRVKNQIHYRRQHTGDTAALGNQALRKEQGLPPFFSRFLFSQIVRLSKIFMGHGER